MKRLFAALDPSPAALRWLQGLQPSAGKGLRLVKPNAMHLTLLFIGEARPAPVIEALQTIHFEPFRVPLRGVGRFEGIQRSHILWAGLASCPPLIELQHQVAEVLHPFIERPDKRPFRPHFTLARGSADFDRGLADSWLSRHRNNEGPSFEVRRIRLYSSRLLESGPIYTQEWPPKS